MGETLLAVVAAVASVGAVIVAALNLVWHASQRRTELQLEVDERSPGQVRLGLRVTNHDHFGILVRGIRLRRPRSGSLHHRHTPAGERLASAREIVVRDELGGRRELRFPLDVVAEPALLEAGIELEVLIEPRFPMVCTRWHRVALAAQP